MDEAVQLNDGILKKAPQDSEALVLKGQILLRQNKFDDALTTLQTAVKNSPDNAAGHYQLGVAMAAKGNSQQAEAEWREATRLRPNYLEAWRPFPNELLRSKIGKTWKI